MDENRAKPGASKYQPDEEEEDEDFYLNDDECDPDEDDYDDYMDEDDEDADYSSQSKYEQTPSVNIQNQSAASVQSSSYPSTCRQLNQINATNSLSKSLTKRQVELDEEFKYEILPPDKIVQYMTECIKDVNSILELNPTVTRALLHHFRWDKEKLMERFYDGDQDRLFREAHVVNPFRFTKRVQL